jgi:hypothetical protein
VNCDGEVDITDVQHVIMAALGLPLSPTLDQNQDSVPDSCQNEAFNGGCQTGQVIKWNGSHWACADDEQGIEGAVTKEDLEELQNMIQALQASHDQLPTDADVAKAIANATNPLENLIDGLTTEIVQQTVKLAALETDSAAPPTNVLSYEPWNPSILLSPISIYDKVYFLSFRAPTTGFYTDATIKTSTGPYDHNKKFKGQLSVGIYSDASPIPAVEPISNYPIQHVPSVKLGEGVHGYESPTDIRGYVDFTFDQPIYLEQDALYWFALTVHNEQNSAHIIFMDFHADYNVVNGDVLEGHDDSWGDLPDFAPDGSNLKFSERALWYRISGPSGASSDGELSQTPQPAPVR